MTQSANARPCNCDQALEAEEQLLLAERRASINFQAYDRLATRFAAQGMKLDGANWTIDQQTKQLDTISRILCDLVNAPCLTVAEFADPTLERIRLAMLGREG